jgi:hypothetical protein
LAVGPKAESTTRRKVAMAATLALEIGREAWSDYFDDICRRGAVLAEAKRPAVLAWSGRRTAGDIFRTMGHVRPTHWLSSVVDHKTTRTTSTSAT